MMTDTKDDGKYFLTCERNWVYFTLITVAGFWGAYTYALRGNVFCNAQTGNVVLMGLALGNGRWGGGSVLSGAYLSLCSGGICIRIGPQSNQTPLVCTLGHHPHVH